jgi:hypothetical protein
MAGKLKEKLESMGIAFLCLATGTGIVASISTVLSIVCMLLVLRFGWASLAEKLAARPAAVPNAAPVAEAKAGEPASKKDE